MGGGDESSNDLFMVGVLETSPHSYEVSKSHLINIDAVCLKGPFYEKQDTPFTFMALKLQK